MVSVHLAHFLAGIFLWVVGAGHAVFSAMEAVDRFLLRSGRGVESPVIFSDISNRCTFTPPRIMLYSFLFQFFLAPVVAAVISCLFCVEFVDVTVLEAVRAAIHGVDESSRPDD